MGGFEVVDPRYRGLYDRAVEVLGADDRVQSVRAGGSIGAGTADAWSDLDLEVVTHAEHHDAFLADRDTWLAAITPTVFARTPIAPFIINTRHGRGPDVRHRRVVRRGAGVADATRAVRRRACCRPPSSRTSAPRSSTRWPSSSAAWPARSSPSCSARSTSATSPASRTSSGCSPRCSSPRPARGAARQALERHLHRGAARAPSPHCRRSARPREGLIAFGLGLAELARHEGPPALRALRPRVAGRPGQRHRRPRPVRAGRRHQRLAALSRRSLSSKFSQ